MKIMHNFNRKINNQLLSLGRVGGNANDTHNNLYYSLSTKLGIKFTKRVKLTLFMLIIRIRTENGINSMQFIKT